MSIFPQGGLAQAYTALSRFIGVEQNTRSQGQGFASQLNKTDKKEFVAGDTLQASARPASKEEGFEEYFVASTTNFDPNAPRGSYINIVV